MPKAKNKKLRDASELMQQISNNNKFLDFEKITIRSKEKINWNCKNCSQEFTRRVECMTRPNSGGVCENCRYVVLYGNSLLKDFPTIASQYSKNNKISIHSISSKSNKKFLWDCIKCQKEFERKPVHLTDIASRCLCDECRYSESSKSYTKTVINKTGSLEMLDKKIINNFFDFDRNELKPKEISVGSNHKIYLKCKYGHKTSRKVTNFVNNPICTKCQRSTSKLELRFLTELRYFYKNVIWQYKIKRIEFDIFLPEHNLAIEIDGSFWHKKKYEQDLKKNKFAKDNNIYLFRIREGNLPEIENSFKTTYTDDRESVLIDFCEHLIKNNKHPFLTDFSKKWLKNNNTNFYNDALFQELLHRLPAPPYAQSLHYLFPKLREEWSDKNLPLTTHDFKPYANKKLWWECLKSDFHEAYLSRPSHRTQGKGCPCCAGRKLAIDNSLEFLKPLIAKRWNYEKNNGLLPKDVLAGTTKKLWWKCKCGHEWEDSLAWIKNDINSRPCKKCKGS